MQLAGRADFQGLFHIQKRKRYHNAGLVSEVDSTLSL